MFITGWEKASDSPVTVKEGNNTHEQNSQNALWRCLIRTPLLCQIPYFYYSKKLKITIHSLEMANTSQGKVLAVLQSKDCSWPISWQRMHKHESETLWVGRFDQGLPRNSAWRLRGKIYLPGQILFIKYIKLMAMDQNLQSPGYFRTVC